MHSTHHTSSLAMDGLFDFRIVAPSMERRLRAVAQVPALSQVPVPDPVPKSRRDAAFAPPQGGA
jgi:hypothetical protein